MRTEIFGIMTAVVAGYVARRATYPAVGGVVDAPRRPGLRGEREHRGVTW